MESIQIGVSSNHTEYRLIFYDLCNAMLISLTYVVQAMWFLVHCLEDQGKIDDALDMCEKVTHLVQEFGGQRLGQKHKFWQYLKEKNVELLRKQKEMSSAGGGQCLPSDHKQTTPPSAVPPKKIVKGFTF